MLSLQKKKQGKMKILGMLIFLAVLVISCQKEPKKGEYKGTFKGKYDTGTSAVDYTTYYYFDITHSTKKELRIIEKQSEITSILKKHEKDSISGMIGFGDIYNPNFGFNSIFVAGKYEKKSITGQFSTTFTDGNKDYSSEGNFIISAY